MPAGLLLMLSAAACATSPTQQIAAPPPGQARIWFYRLWDSSESLNVANIDVNGVYVGSVEPGGALYRDVNPGVASDLRSDTSPESAACEASGWCVAARICPPEDARHRIKRVEQLGYREILIGSQFGAIEEIKRVRDFIDYDRTGQAKPHAV